MEQPAWMKTKIIPLINASTEKPSVLISAHSETGGENSIRVQYVWAQQLTLEK